MISELGVIQDTLQGAQSGAQGTQGATLDQFLKLLLAQLQHQDPLNPMEAREFTAQLAQFSMLEQAVQTNQTLNTLKLYEASANNARALGLIGKEITARGDALWLDLDQGADLRFRLSAETTSTEVRIYNEIGRLVRTLSIGPRGLGDQSCHWDGLDLNGLPAPEGRYRFEVEAKDLNGNPVEAACFLQGRVDAVRFEDGNTSVVVSGIPVYLGDVIEVKD